MKALLSRTFTTAVFALFCFGLNAYGQTSTFRFIELAPLSGDVSSAALSINHKNQVVGYSASAEGRKRAVLWNLPGTGSVLTPALILPDLGGGFAEANDINDLGEVVGQAATATGQPHACLWNQFGVVSDLHVLFNSPFATALAINNVRDIVGYKINSSLQPEALIIRRGAVESWPTTSIRRATDIDHLRQAVGNGQTTTENKAYSSASTRAATLQPLAGYPQAEVMATNLLGEKAGACGAEDKLQAVIWKGDRVAPISLGTLGGDYSKSLGMNQFFSIVGIAQVSSKTPLTSSTATTNVESFTPTSIPPIFNELDRAFWWNAGRLFDLNKMTTLPANWTLQAATSVNDFQEIVGYGNSAGNLRGYALLPTRPSSIAIRAYFTKVGAYYTSTDPVELWLCLSKRSTDIRVNIDGLPFTQYTSIPYPVRLTGLTPGYHEIEISAKDPNSPLTVFWRGSFTVAEPTPSMAAFGVSGASSSTQDTKIDNSLISKKTTDFELPPVAYFYEMLQNFWGVATTAPAEERDQAVAPKK